MTAIDFRLMIVRHHELLRPYALSLTHDSADADDLCQETMLRALLNEMKFQQGTNLKAWLITIMRNIFINNYRRSRRIVSIEPEQTDALTQAAGRNAANDGWVTLRMKEIGAAMAALPRMFALCFELHYTGYKYQEIANLLQEPLGTIKSRIHFARKQMMAAVER